MATTVPVDEATKARLDRLQSEIERETGRSVSQRALLTRMIEREYESRDALVDEFRDDGDEGVDGDDHVDGDGSDDEWEGLSDEEIERWLSGTSDWGTETTEAEIDEILYEREVTSEFDDE